MFTDMPETALRTFRSAVLDPSDFDEFWASTLSTARSAAVSRPPSFTPFPTPLTSVTITDVAFAGFGGDEVRGWLVVPAGADAAADPAAGADAAANAAAGDARPALPAVIEYLGYGGGRGNPLAHLLYASAGFVHFVMDSRGQGSGRGQGAGATADPHGSGPAFSGVMTRGITDRDTYYYRRLFTDAVLAVDVVAALPFVDSSRVGVVGGSQGGALALAVAGLRNDLAAVVAFVPFLSDILRATTITNENPYAEIAHYLATQRDQVDVVASTLAYFDGVNFARRATAPVWYSAALMDPVCPPSTVFASYNEYAGPKQLTVWPYNGHEGGAMEDRAAALRVFAETLGG
ncbi:MAG: cephalosporin-C deacetylase [Subtercola sp.]|nr:cephalosporin-C deacetylase [Subtercola sp.]